MGRIIIVTDPNPESLPPRGGRESGLHQQGCHRIIEIPKRGTLPLGWTLHEKIFQGGRAAPLEIARRNTDSLRRGETKPRKAASHPGWILGNGRSGNRGMVAVIFAKHQGGHQKLGGTGGHVSHPELHHDLGQASLQGIHAQSRK